jgi:hypothetical protein
MTQPAPRLVVDYIASRLDARANGAIGRSGIAAPGRGCGFSRPESRRLERPPPARRASASSRRGAPAQSARTSDRSESPRLSDLAPRRPGPPEQAPDGAPPAPPHATPRVGLVLGRRPALPVLPRCDVSRVLSRPRAVPAHRLRGGPAARLDGGPTLALRGALLHAARPRGEPAPGPLLCEPAPPRPSASAARPPRRRSCTARQESSVRPADPPSER